MPRKAEKPGKVHVLRVGRGGTAPAELTPLLQQLMLPMIAGMAATKRTFQNLVMEFGLASMQALFGAHAEALAGPKHKHQHGRTMNHWGSVASQFPFAGRKVTVSRPRLRTRDGGGDETPAGPVARFDGEQGGVHRTAANGSVIATAGPSGSLLSSVDYDAFGNELEGAFRRRRTATSGCTACGRTPAGSTTCVLACTMQKPVVSRAVTSLRCRAFSRRVRTRTRSATRIRTCSAIHRESFLVRWLR